MDFKKIALISNSSNITSGILSLILAFAGAGVWSLAFNSVASIVIAMPLFFIATKWKPKIIFERQAFKEVFGFGIYTTGTNITNYLIGSVDYLLIGKLLSAQALGTYTFAFILTDTFRSRLMSVMNTVLYPLYSKMQDNPASLKKYYLKVVEYNSVMIFPVMVFFITMADPVLLVMFGEKWTDSVEPLRVLSVAVMVHMMVNSNTALIRGMGRPGLEMKLQIFKAAIFLPMLYFAIVHFGVVGAAYAVLINKIIAVVIAQFTFYKLLAVKVTTVDFFNAVKIPWVAALITGSSVMLLKNSIELHYILLSIILFSLYGLIVWLFMGKELLDQIYNAKAAKSIK